MNPSASSDDALIPVGHLIGLLNEQDEEVQKLKEKEKERQEKAAKRAQQTQAKSTADVLTRRLLKHANDIRAAVPTVLKNGKPGQVPAKLKNACGSALQAISLQPPLLSLSLSLSLSSPLVPIVLTIFMNCYRLSNSSSPKWTL